MDTINILTPTPGNQPFAQEENGTKTPTPTPIGTQFTPYTIENFSFELPKTPIGRKQKELPKRIGNKNEEIDKDTSIFTKKRGIIWDTNTTQRGEILVEENLLEKAIQRALLPLKEEIVALKKEIQSLKTQKWTPEATTPVTTKIVAPVATKEAQKIATKVAKKSYAEIVKENTTISIEDSQANIKLAKNQEGWTLVSKEKKTPKQALAPQKNVAPVDRRCLFTRENKERKIDLKDLLLALNKAIL
jgi:hypothetical protein